MREKRLIAGVYTLSELPDKLRDQAMLMPKIGKGRTFEDAEAFANSARLRLDPTREDNPYDWFIDEAIAAEPDFSEAVDA